MKNKEVNEIRSKGVPSRCVRLFRPEAKEGMKGTPEGKLRKRGRGKGESGTALSLRNLFVFLARSFAFQPRSSLAPRVRFADSSLSMPVVFVFSFRPLLPLSPPSRGSSRSFPFLRAGSPAFTLPSHSRVAPRWKETALFDIVVRSCKSLTCEPGKPVWGGVGGSDSLFFFICAAGFTCAITSRRYRYLRPVAAIRLRGQRGRK